MNSCHLMIKFTEEHSRTDINFLDTTVKLDSQRRAYTTLYVKPTDTHMYLHYRSAHPKHSITGGPYSQLLRVKRICSRPEDFEDNAQKILTFYQLRGYPIELLQESKAKVDALNRTQLLAPQPEQEITDQQNFFLVTRYNPSLPPIKQIIQDNWKILEPSRHATVLANKEVKIGFKRTMNIQDMLVHSRIRYNPIPDHNPAISGRKHTNSCERTNCKYCTRLATTGRATSTQTGRSYSVPQGGCCESSNLIYLLTCDLCDKQYVGQTKRPLRDRLREHFRYISNRNIDQPLGRHFAQADHDGLNIKVQIGRASCRERV